MANEPENRNEQNGEAVKPKKKNIIRLFRPQNSKTGAVKTQRPGAEHHRPRPEGARPVRRRPAGNGSVQEHAAEETRKTVRPEVSASAAAAETEKAAKQIQKAVLSSEKVQEAAAVKEGTAAVKKEETAAVKKEEAAGAKAPAGSGVKPVTEKVSAEKAAPAEKPAVQKGTPEKISAEKTVPAGKAAEEKPAAAEKAAADKKAASAGKIADEGKESLVKADHRHRRAPLRRKMRRHQSPLTAVREPIGIQKTEIMATAVLRQQEHAAMQVQEPEEVRQEEPDSVPVTAHVRVSVRVREDMKTRAGRAEAIRTVPLRAAAAIRETAPDRIPDAPIRTETDREADAVTAIAAQALERVRKDPEMASDAAIHRGRTAIRAVQMTAETQQGSLRSAEVRLQPTNRWKKRDVTVMTAAMSMTGSAMTVPISLTAWSVTGSRTLPAAIRIAIRSRSRQPRRYSRRQKKSRALSFRNL